MKTKDPQAIRTDVERVTTGRGTPRKLIPDRSAEAARIIDHAEIPPSTISNCPVTNSDLSESKNLTGPMMSSGTPSRPRGVRRRILPRARQLVRQDGGGQP